MKKIYINIHIRLLEEYQDIAAALIMGFPYTGIEQHEDEIIISFDSKDWNDSVRNEIVNILKRIDSNTEIISEELIQDKNWNEEWEKNIPAIHVNSNIGIAPECKKSELYQKIQIIINPKMSFGTGGHETTRLCCKLMENSVNQNSSWIDVGTGTGVLAILAAKLGANKIEAFDNNEWSVENAKENFILNNVDKYINLQEIEIDDYVFPETDAIVANLFLHLVLENLPKFYNALSKKKGILIVSGILKFHRDDVIEKANSIGFHLIEEITENEWIAFKFKV